MRRARGFVAALVVALTSVANAAPAERVASAFSTVGVRGPSGDAPAVTLYTVPDGRTFLLTDVLVANYGQEVGPLYLGDTSGTRCAIELLQTTLIANVAGGFFTLQNPHTTFATGLAFGPGESVIATLAGGVNGIDVTISGKLLPGPRLPKAVRLPGGGTDAGSAPSAEDAAD